MSPITRTEEYILLAVLALGDEAYGTPIRRYLETTLNTSLSVGAVYVPLERLAEANLLSSYQGDPTPERGGRRKRFYRLTPEGLAALQEAKRSHDALWANVAGPDFPWARQ